MLQKVVSAPTISDFPWKSSKFLKQSTAEKKNEWCYEVTTKASQGPPNDVNEAPHSPAILCSCSPQVMSIFHCFFLTTRIF